MLHLWHTALVVAHPSSAVGFDFDDGNLEKLARRGISPSHVRQVHRNGPMFRRNKRSVTATWLMTGRDDGGRELVVAVLWADEAERILRPITGWPA